MIGMTTERYVHSHHHHLYLPT